MSMTITIMGCVLTVMLTALGVMTIAWMWYCIRRDDEVIVHRDSHERILTLRTEKTLSAEERKKLVEIAMEMRDEM